MTSLTAYLDRLIAPIIALSLMSFAASSAFTFVGVHLTTSNVLLFTVATGLLIASLLFKWRPISALRRIQEKRNVGTPQLLLALLSFLISLTISDIVLRFLLPSGYAPTRYGWTVPEKVTKTLRFQDTTGNPRWVRNRYFEHGFKRWGDTATHRKKMLIIGDSFTHMNWVSNGEEWYSYLETGLKDVELFVYGGGGYGPLQEYLVLDDHFDEIDPDVILWQFCGNDYANSVYALDKLEYPYNNIGYRPYLENGRIVYRLPAPFTELRGSSFIADRVLMMYDKISLWWGLSHLDDHWREQARLQSLETEEEKAEREQLLEEAGQIVSAIMLRVSKRIGETPAYFFNACGGITEQEERICAETGMTCITGVTEHVQSYHERTGVQVIVTNDQHWNKRGNELVGEKLVEILQRERAFQRIEGSSLAFDEEP